jgi:8-oxo-dGTP pyrophosphatase MutT (NUDIX family)
LPKLVAQAGAIAFKIIDGLPFVLLVRAKKNPEHWIFPKGHIDEGETAEIAAGRELEEEAAISADLVAPAGALEFQSGNELVHVEYFLFRFRAEAERTEDREVRWCTYEEALELLSHPDAAALLRKTRPQLKDENSK